MRIIDEFVTSTVLRVVIRLHLAFRGTVPMWGERGQWKYLVKA